MAQSNISIRVDKNLKEQFDKICDELGFTMTTAINMFLRKVVRERGIPFALSLNDYNEETRKVIEQTEQEKGLVGPFNNMEDLKKSLEED